jgi:streptomycin 6-kinase
VSLVVPVVLPSGRPGVLKISPGAESEGVAEAFRHWRGRGAVRLLAYDESRAAILVERCVPGRQLRSVPDARERDRIVAEVFRRLWRAPPENHRFRLLADEAARWRRGLAAGWARLGHPFDARLCDIGLAALDELPASQVDEVVCHQDLHAGNVLAAEREPWLAIDPHPIVGEPAFDVASSLVRGGRSHVAPEARRSVRRRIDFLASELGLDRDRVRGWAIGRALAWSVSGATLKRDMVQVARLFAAG